MSALYSLNVYGHVLEAWLEDTLDSIHLSTVPKLTWFDAEKLQRRIWNYINPSPNSTTNALYSQYETALLGMARTSQPNTTYTTDNYQAYYTGHGSSSGSSKEQILLLNFSLSKTLLFDAKGSFIGDLTLRGADGSNLSNHITAALADPYTFNNPDRHNDSLVVLLNNPLPDGATLEVDFNQDARSDLNIGPLRYESKPYADPWRPEAFQLDLISKGKRITVTGQENSEGWLDLDQNRVVLKVNDPQLQQDALVQFGYDQALPDNLHSWLTYSVDDLQAVEGGGISFQLMDSNTGEPVQFGLSNGETDSGFGIRLALGELENKLVFDNLYSAESQRILLNPAVLADLRIQVRDPGAAKNATWSEWTDLSLASATAAWSELRLNLDQSNEPTDIPAEWNVRLSYDDLLQESIRAADLENGVYLQFDQVLITEIFNALADHSISAAKLSLGPEGTTDFLSFNLSDYSSSTDLYAAIANAKWAALPMNVNTAVLPLQAVAPGQNLTNFQVQFRLLRESGGKPEPVYNVAQLVARVEDEWMPIDPDGFSLWKEQSGAPVAIDRYGDQLDRLGEQTDGAEPPSWSDYHPWVSINGDWFKPWDEQRISPKTIEIEGDNFDGGDDLLIKFSLELPDDPSTAEWEGEWRDYVLLFDLFTDSQTQLTTFERDTLFQQELYGDINPLGYKPSFAVDVEISSKTSLSSNNLLDAFAAGLRKFLSSAEADLLDKVPGFTLSTPTLNTSSGRSVLQATLDFSAPADGIKPSVNLWSRVLDDPSNSAAYDKAWQTYSNYTASDAQEWLNNYGSRQPQFQSAWTNPLEGNEPSTRTITLDYNGLDPLSDTYIPGDLQLSLNNKLVDHTLYTVENLSGYQLQITFNIDSGLLISADSDLTISLADNHSFVDTTGHRLSTTSLAVDNWAAWQRYGFNLNEHLFIDQDNSYADDATIRLSFYGSSDLSLDGSKAIAPQQGDFQFWSYDFKTGETQALVLDPRQPLKVDGNALLFTLANPIESDVSVDVTYDPLLDPSDSDAFTNTNGIEAQAFYWQRIENRSPDKQGPSISWSNSWGNQLTLSLSDAAGIWVGDQTLSASNLPEPSDFLIKASDTSGKSRTLTATSIRLAPWGSSELELQLDASVQQGDTLSLSYQGRNLKDGNGNPATLFQVPINNNTIAYDDNNASSWFQSNDRIAIVFDEIVDAGGFYLMENGSVSSRPDNFQIQDDYSFSLPVLSQIRVNLTDRAGDTLNDEGDANLDFTLENLRTQSLIGGSWNSLMDSWLKNDATNDERGVKFVLPAGDYRLSVMHTDLWRDNEQNYQLEITHSPINLKTTQLDTNESQLIATASTSLSRDGNSVASATSVYLDLQDAGEITAALSTLTAESWLDLYDLNGLWIDSSYGQALRQYVLPGLYRLELGSRSALPADVKLDLKLDSSVRLNVDTDSRGTPSGSLSVNGLPAKGELNQLDREDFWTIKLNGGQIYSLRASGFSDDVNLIVEDTQGDWVADSWNWGAYADDGTFIPSDETIVLDLSDKPTGTYTYTAQVQTWGNTPSKYTLIAKSHADLGKAEEEATRGVIGYDSLFDDYFGDDSGRTDAIDFSKDDLAEFVALQEVSSEKLRELKAALEKLGVNPSGNVLGIQTTLNTPVTGSVAEPKPILISKTVPQGLPEQISNRLNGNEPGELSDKQSQLQFGPKQIAELADDTKDEASGLEPVSKPVGVKVESRQRRLGGFLAQDLASNQLITGGALAPELEGYDLGLQRISIPLDDKTRAALANPDKVGKTLVWYKTPAIGDAWLFTYDETTGTGARLEDTDMNQDGHDAMVLYIQDGGRGDDDGRVNGEIVSPGGLALAQLRTASTGGGEGGPLVGWNADIDGDGLFLPLSDGLALVRRFSRPDLRDDPLIGSYAATGSPRLSTVDMLSRIDAGFDDGRLELDGSGSTDLTDLSLALRHGFGTFPGESIMTGLDLPSSTSLNQLNNQLQLLMPTVQS